MLFNVIDPARAAGRKHRQRHGFVFFARFEPFKKLSAFFHNDDVGGKVCVHHIIHTDVFERIDNKGFNVFARSKAELFAKRYANSRGHLHNRHRFRVINHIKHPVGFIFFAQGTGGAHQGALTALHALRGVRAAFGTGHCDTGHRAEVVNRQRTDSLHLAAHFHAADALINVAHDTHRRVIKGAFGDEV